MIKFNPENKDKLTIGEALGPAMEIVSQEEADQYFADYVEFIKKQPDFSNQNLSAEDIAKINLGYHAGYYDLKTLSRVHKLFLRKEEINSMEIDEIGLNL